MSLCLDFAFAETPASSRRPRTAGTSVTTHLPAFSYRSPSLQSSSHRQPGSAPPPPLLIPRWFPIALFGVDRYTTLADLAHASTRAPAGSIRMWHCCHSTPVDTLIYLPRDIGSWTFLGQYASLTYCIICKDTLGVLVLVESSSLLGVPSASPASPPSTLSVHFVFSSSLLCSAS